MKVDYVEETSVRKALTFEVEPEVLEREIDQRARDHARKARLPGFRPGKVPAHVIRQRYRGQVIDEAVEAVVNRLVPPELEGRGLHPLAAPKLADLNHAEGQPLTFRIVFETLPLVDLPEWRGLEARARQAQVSEEEVDKDLDALRQRNADFDPVEGRAAQPGDFCVVDLSWSPLDGGNGGRDENVLIELGGEGTAPEVRDALLGALPGDTREAEVTTSGSGDAPPRTLRYTLALKSIKTRRLPELDDEFAKDLGDFETLGALRDDVRRRRLQEAERAIDREVKEALVDELCRRAEFEVPESLVERHMAALTERLARSMSMQGIDPTKTGIDWKQMREAQRGAATRAAKADVLLDELAKREGITVSAPELDAEVARYAQLMRQPKEQLRARLEKDGDLSALRVRIREEKTLDLLKANARLTFE